MRARLTIEVGVGSPPELDLEPSATATLGRSRDSTLVLHDEHASRQHAQVYAQRGQWLLRDLGTLNGTYLNGERITEAVPLQDGQLIGIADMRLCFHMEDSNDSGIVPVIEACPEKEGGSALATHFWPDELAPLYEFMTATVDEKEPAAVVARALETVARRTRASFCGFLSFDAEAPVSKQVYPESATADGQLSRQLTRRAREQGCTIWVQAAPRDIEATESLASYGDAICVPLRGEGAPLGAMHVYRDKGMFTAREVRFCEVVAGYAASSLTLLRLCRRLSAENSRLRHGTPISEELIGASAAMRPLRQRIARAAESSATVLIHGETGVGKELVATALHRQSPRWKSPLVVANCGAIAESLWESELFGHCRGAFTGAVNDRAGLFQQADDGTLFLDEIGDMPVDGQVKLLRAIESKTFRPVGADRDMVADVRVVAATHRDLEKEVKAGNFREDLFYRLRVIYIPVPPLREHAEDIPALVEYFLRKLSPAPGRARKLSGKAMDRLKEYDWPGNVRQLRAALENALVMAEEDTLEPSDFYLPGGHAPAAPLTLEELEISGIKSALERTSGNIVQAAKALGIHRETLAKKIKQYHLSRNAECFTLLFSERHRVET